MISVDAPTYEFLMRVLRDSELHHPHARSAADMLLVAALESEERNGEFFNEVPALCRLQAD